MTTTNLTDLRRIAQGREAEIYAWDETHVVRLFRGARTQESLERERAVMAAARAAMPNVPEVGEIVEIDGRPGLIMERIDGRDMLSVLSSKPWTVANIGKTCGELHARMHEALAPEMLETQHERIRGIVTRLPGLVPPDLRDIALAVLQGLPDGDRVCHGDFHPANVLASPRGPVVIDWPNATRGDPTADFARSLLILRLGEPPPGTAAWMRAAASFARRLLISGYERAYRRARTVDEDLLRRWSIVKAVERFVDDIPSERPALRRFIEREYATIR